MRLFDLIWGATVEKDPKVVWDTILRFEPFIIKACTDHITGEINEDLMSDIHMKLPQRINNFSIFE